MLIRELITFLKRPKYQHDEQTALRYRLTVFLKLLALSLAISIVLGMLIGSLESLTGLHLGEHATEVMFDNYPPYYILIAAVILAPMLEELLFRGPMVFFNTTSKFSYVFYFLTFAFAFYHLINYEISTTVILLSPLLVAPQLSVGVLLGFIRVRFGLQWAILLHAFYNLILVGPVLLLKVLDIPLE